MGKKPEPSPREFGFVMSAFFAALFFYSLLLKQTFKPRLLAVSVIVLLFALLLPRALRIPAILWGKLGALLHKIMNPLIMGVIYFGIFTAFAFFLRLLKKDFLRLQSSGEEKSFWIERYPPGPAEESFSKQF